MIFSIEEQVLVDEASKTTRAFSVDRADGTIAPAPAKF